MKTNFSQPRFTGARFDEHTLPVDVARDLAAYEAMILDLAKHLYLLDHPERQRVPRGFSTNFRLDIERIDPGSSKPMLALVLAGALALQGGERDYFEQARDLIAECVAAPINALPDKFPRELLSHFNQFGRSLRADETLELELPNELNPASLTPEKRKDLVLASGKFYEKEIDLYGYIDEVDFGKSSLRLRLLEGGSAIIPMPDSFSSTARTYGGRERHVVNVKGIGVFDAWERIQKVIQVQTLDLTKNFAIATKLDELSQLRNGWFEGAGLAPHSSELAIISEKLIGEYPDNLLLPIFTPTQDGNLLLEWNSEGDPSLDIDLKENQAFFHSFGSSEEDEVERDFNLDQNGWKDLFSFLNATIKSEQA